MTEFENFFLAFYERKDRFSDRIRQNFGKKRMLNLMFESKNKGQKKIKQLFVDTCCRHRQETVGLNDVRFLAKQRIVVR